MPFRFGPDPYTDIRFGESRRSASTFKSVEFGASEPKQLWWGPGIQHALVLEKQRPRREAAFSGNPLVRFVSPFIGTLSFDISPAGLKDSDYYPQGNSTALYVSTARCILSRISYPGLSVGCQSSIPYVCAGGWSHIRRDLLIDAVSGASAGRRYLHHPERDGLGLLPLALSRALRPRCTAPTSARTPSTTPATSFCNPTTTAPTPSGFRSCCISGVHFDFVRVNLELSNLVPNRIQEVRPQVMVLPPLQNPAGTHQPRTGPRRLNRPRIRKPVPGGRRLLPQR
jgi:hypothetical protein